MLRLQGVWAMIWGCGAAPVNAFGVLGWGCCIPGFGSHGDWDGVSSLLHRLSWDQQHLQGRRLLGKREQAATLLSHNPLPWLWVWGPVQDPVTCIHPPALGLPTGHPAGSRVPGGDSHSFLLQSEVPVSGGSPCPVLSCPSPLGPGWLVAWARPHCMSPSGAVGATALGRCGWLDLWVASGKR